MNHEAEDHRFGAASVALNCRPAGEIRMVPKPVAAFFDFDKTILEGDSQGLEIKYFAAQGLIPFGRLLKLRILNALYARGLLPASTMVQACISSFRGWTKQDLEGSAQKFFDAELKPRLRPQLMSRIDHHRKKGHVIVLISASVSHVIALASEEIGADYAFYTELDVDDNGALTGQTNGQICIGKQKQRRAMQLAESLSICLDDSYAYSDHHADLPLLEAVGHPVAVSPTRKLERIARQRKWPIITLGTSKEDRGYALDFKWHSKRE